MRTTALAGLLRKPTQAVGRYTYETGLGKSTRIGGAEMVPAGSEWERTAAVAQTPCLLISMEIVIQPSEVSRVYWALAYDAQPSDELDTAYAANQLGAARYNWGPVSVGANGGLILRDAGELWSVRTILPNGECVDEEIRGFPFDRGIYVVVSSSPRVPTAPGPQFSVVARVQGNQG